MATSTIFNFNFNNSEIVDSTGQWYDATTGTPTTEFIEHDGNTALLQRAYIAETSYLRNINPVFFQSRDPTFTAHTYTIELQIYPLRDSGGYGPWDGDVLDFNPTESDERGWVRLRSVQRASESNTFYWKEYNLSGTGIPFLTVTAADGTYNRWYSIRIERVDDGTNTGATVKIYVDGALVANETLTYPQDARRGRISDSVRYTYRRNSTSPSGAGVAIDNFKLTAGIAPSSVVDVSLANLQRNNANLLSFIKGKVPTVNDGTLTIQKNGTNVATFTANASTNATANIEVPTKTSDLTNDSGFITEDTTKIPLAGSNQISGSLIPSTDGTVNLGGSSYQWNNAYIKSLTINGVACGDILTHNVSEFVDVSSNQDIGGIKTFSAGLFASKSTAGDLVTLTDLSINSTNEDANGMPLTGHTNSIKIKGSQFNVVPCMLTGQVFASGNTSAEMRVYKYKDISRMASFNIHYAYSNDTAVAQFINCNISTNSDGLYNIGSSARRFNTAYVKAINNLNPGALSLPSDAYIDVDTTNWDLTCQNGLLGSFTPTADGWLMLSVDNSGTSEVNFWIIGGVIRINNKSSINTTDNNNFNMFTIPVEKDVTYNIYGNASEYVAGRSIAYCRFMPCRGNV